LYDEDEYDWPGGIRFRLPCLHGLPWRLFGVALGLVAGWRLGRMIRSMRIRLETLEAILLDQSPRR
jgi:hypothetical protein